MADTKDAERVTQRQLYETMGAMEGRIVGKIDALRDVLENKENTASSFHADVLRKVAELTVQVKHNEKEIDALRARSNGWDTLNTIGAIIAGILAVLLGR